MAADPTRRTLQQSVQDRWSSFTQELQTEAKGVAAHTLDAIKSLAWLWPFRGLLYSVLHPRIILSARQALLKSLLSSAVIFAVVSFFTYSLLILSFFGRALLLEPALSHVFDVTLIARGQGQLVKDGKLRTQSTSARGVQSALVKPLQAFSKDGIVRYVLTLPLNMIPAAGTIFFLLYNGSKSGPGWHARYFQLKGFSKGQRATFIEKRAAEYTAFGAITLVFNFIPLIGLLFTFTNTVGAALWAAQLEAQANLVEGQGSALQPHAKND
ncbi:hypothetical protein C8Q78DRAFT_1066503 [Trametes maxima]|nr:hypothetical protein C8Q78DRAFT_1066503 [Trametes maxima]